MKKQEVVMEFEQGSIIRLYADKVYNMAEPNSELNTYPGDMFTTLKELLKEHPGCEVMGGFCIVEPQTGIIIPSTEDWYDSLEDALFAIQELKYQKEVDSLYDKVRGYYYDYKPNDPTYLEENQELAEEIDFLDDLEPNSFQEKLKALSLLTEFVNEWFPDCLEDEEEQNDILNAIEKSREQQNEIIKTVKETNELSNSL